MKKWMSCLVLLLVTACNPGARAVSMQQYQEVSRGMSVKELELIFGRPYEKIDIGNGEISYKYIERIIGNGRVMEQREYFFIVKEGKVINKNVVTKTRPISDPRNPMDLQTSYQFEDRSE